MSEIAVFLIGLGIGLIVHDMMPWQRAKPPMPAPRERDARGRFIKAPRP